jgi:ankyrin repeat protein
MGLIEEAMSETQTDSRSPEEKLCQALRYDFSQTAFELIDQVVNINTVDANKCTPLMLAAKGNYSDSVFAELEGFFSPGYLEKRKLFNSIAPLLIEKGADVTPHDEEGNTALYYAMTSGAPSLVSLLIEKGADINTKNHAGVTPLMNAMRIPTDIEAIKLLIKAGANLNERDSYGQTALMYASVMATVGSSGNFTKYKDIIAYLIEHGAKSSIKSGISRTAYEMIENPAFFRTSDAMIQGYKSQYLLEHPEVNQEQAKMKIQRLAELPTKEQVRLGGQTLTLQLKEALKVKIAGDTDKDLPGRWH